MNLTRCGLECRTRRLSTGTDERRRSPGSWGPQQCQSSLCLCDVAFSTLGAYGAQGSEAGLLLLPDPGKAEGGSWSSSVLLFCVCIAAPRPRGSLARGQSPCEDQLAFAHSAIHARRSWSIVREMLKTWGRLSTCPALKEVFGLALLVSAWCNCSRSVLTTASKLRRLLFSCVQVSTTSELCCLDWRPKSKRFKVKPP